LLQTQQTERDMKTQKAEPAELPEAQLLSRWPDTQGEGPANYTVFFLNPDGQYKFKTYTQAPGKQDPRDMHDADYVLVMDHTTNKVSCARAPSAMPGRLDSRKHNHLTPTGIFWVPQMPTHHPAVDAKVYMDERRLKYGLTDGDFCFVKGGVKNGTGEVRPYDQVELGDELCLVVDLNSRGKALLHSSKIPVNSPLVRLEYAGQTGCMDERRLEPTT
jgi:hypothetical protein